MNPALAAQIFQFEDYDLDRGAFELRRTGDVVPLERIPLELLFLLVERSGKLVTREEIVERIWGKDVFVDVDNGINTAIRKIRKALKDNSENPRVLQTVPGKGYRFAATVGVARPGETQATKPGSQISIEPSFRFRRPQYWRVTIALALVLIVASFVFRSHSSTPRRSTNERVMLGVLPFQNISGDPQQEYFSDGLTEETITDLGQLNPEQLGVIARTSAMAYKSTKKTATEIGHELGVDYLLEGSVRRDSGSVRISAQLIRVEDGSHIWARNYQRDVKNILQAQIELGDAIAQQVQVRLPESLRRQQGKAFTLNPDAYDLYLRGRDQWYQRTPEAMQKSIAYFQQAIDRDPKFAMAYVGLADAYNISQVVGLPGIPRRPGEIYPRAKAAALMALKLDPQLGEAHTALAFEETHFDFDWQSAEKEFLRGIELNPSSAYAHLFYSNCYLSPMGRHKQAIAEMKKALALDPLSLAINNFLGNTYFYAGQDDLAVEQFHKTIEMNPGFVLAHYYLADVLARLERFDESISEFEKAEVLSKQNPELAALAAHLCDGR